MTAAPSIRILADRPGHVVSRYLYGQFIEHIGRCVYGGIWVGEDSKIPNDGGIRLDTIAALKRLKLPALRWPGGCFADSYHWMDGIGPRDRRPKRYNLWWRQPEPNAFGTDEVMRFCALIGAEPYVCANVGSGTVEEARAWIEYCNGTEPSSLVEMRADNGHPEPYSVKFWGVGNESWGCGGNLRPEFAADLCRLYATTMRQAAGDEAKLIAVGSEPSVPDWDERFLDALGERADLIDYIGVHVYSASGIAEIEFSDDDYTRLVVDGIKRKTDYLRRALDVVRAHATPRRALGVILDEWGTWYKEATVERGNWQQSTMQDALFTAVSFHKLHEFAPELFMANMAQTINVLQALILTQGPRLVCTPTYHVWELFMPHRDGRLVPCEVASTPTITSPKGTKADALSFSATLSADGKELFVSVVNLDITSDCSTRIEIRDASPWTVREVRRLATGELRSHNTFDAPETVVPQEVPVKRGARLDEMTFPAQSVTTVRLARK